MNYYFQKDSREFCFSCDTDVEHDSDKYVKVWVADPSKIDMMFKYTLDSDNQTLIKGAESHAAN